MQIILISFIVVFFVLSICKSSYLNFSNEVSYNRNLEIILGFSTLISILFILSYPITKLNIKSSIYFNYLFVLIIAIQILSFKNMKIKFRWKANLFIIILTFIYLTISLKYTLGEQMGDNTYIFIQVIKNINAKLLNNFDFNNGLIFSHVFIYPTKSFISFYHLLSFLSYFAMQFTLFLNLNYIPAYVISMWVSNLLFFIFSAQIILSIFEIFSIKSKLLIFIILIFLGLYMGSYYYNITLPHIGMTFLGLTLSATVLILYDYFQTFNRKTLLLLFVLLYSMNGYATTGALYVMVFSFGIVTITFFKKNKDAFIQIPLFLIPILHYSLIILQVPSIGLILFIFYIIVSSISFLFYFKPKLSNFIFNNFKFILGFIWILLVIYSVLRIDNYWIKVPEFFNPRSGFDRVQDYFTFNTISQTLMNLFHYCLIICLLLYRKTRDIGWMLVIFLVFFINPLLRPIVAENIAHYEIYNRIFFTVFNTGTLGMGLVALYEILMKSKCNSKANYIISGLTIILLIPTYQQVTTYFYPTYVPREKDYNPLYKMSNNQIEILEKMRQIVVIEEMENPLIISQIFGTAMYAPEFVVLGYNVNQQRYGPIYIGQELYEIFYTPAIPADDGPRLNAPVRKTCELLISQQIDFVLYDKSMAVYDSEIGDYMPIYWYIRDCGTYVFENDRYILYRFFWE